MYQTESITSQVRVRLQSFINDNTAPWYAFFCCSCDGEDRSVTIADRLVAFIDELSPSLKLPLASSQRLLSMSSLSAEAPLLSLNTADIDNITLALLKTSTVLMSTSSTEHLTAKRRALNAIFNDFLPSTESLTAPAHMITALSNYLNSSTRENALILQKQLQTHHIEGGVGVSPLSQASSLPCPVLLREGRGIHDDTVISGSYIPVTFS